MRPNTARVGDKNAIAASCLAVQQQIVNSVDAEQYW